MKNPLQSFLVAFLSSLLIIFLLFCGWLPFQSLALEFLLLGTLTVISAFFLAQGISRVIEKHCE